MLLKYWRKNAFSIHKSYISGNLDGISRLVAVLVVVIEVAVAKSVAVDVVVAVTFD